MEHIDPKVAAQVWQRVQGGPALPKRSPKGLALQEHMAFAAYQRLARQLPEHSAAFSKMAEDARHHIAVLRGVELMNDRQTDTLPPIKPVLEPAALTLKKCYSSALSMAAAYDDLSADTEYGCAFEEMAQRKREHCCKILMLLGSLK